MGLGEESPGCREGLTLRRSRDLVGMLFKGGNEDRHHVYLEEAGERVPSDNFCFFQEVCGSGFLQKRRPVARIVKEVCGERTFLV